MLANATRHKVLEYPTFDERGVQVLLVVVKATFEYRRGRMVPAAEPSPVRPADELLDPSNGNSSVLLPGDLALPKPLLDVIVRGRAHAPQPVPTVDVAVQFRGKTAPLRVHGPRLFEPDIVGLKLGHPRPFEEQDITYEWAYGGVSRDLSEVELRNPAGRGVATSAGELEGQRAPQIEHPDRPYRGFGDKPEPAGFGAIPPHWSPRREYFGTYDDERYLTMIAPLYPESFDPRYHQQAHPQLQFAGHLRGGEAFRTLGLTRERLWEFLIPDMQVRMRCIYDQRSETRECPVDTLLVEPHLGRIEMVARAALPLGRSPGQLLREVHVDDWA